MLQFAVAAGVAYFLLRGASRREDKSQEDENRPAPGGIPIPDRPPVDGDADGDGVCANEDCDDNNGSIGGEGSACNDGDPNTQNDALDANCNCVGTPVSTDCDVTIETVANGVKIINIIFYIRVLNICPYYRSNSCHSLNIASKRCKL